MSAALFLVPLSLFVGLVGSGAFLWTFRDNRFEDPEGCVWRVLTPKDPSPESGPDTEPQAGGATDAARSRRSTDAGTGQDGDQERR